MPFGVTDWERVVGKKWKTSAQFHRLDDAVRDYIRKRGQVGEAKSREDLRVAWNSWIAKLQAEGRKGNPAYKGSDRYGGPADPAGRTLDEIASMFSGSARPPAPLAARAPVGPNMAEVLARAASIQSRLVQGEAPCDEPLTEVLRADGTVNDYRYDWTVHFRLRKIPAGHQGQGIAVIMKLAAFSGNGPEYAQAISRHQVNGIPAHYAGAALTDEVKRRWHHRISERWGGASFVVQDVNGRDLEAYRISFEFEWDNSAAHKIYAVQATDATVPPDGTIDASFWGVDDGGLTGAAIAHEFGHLIGNPDEYGTCNFNGKRNTRDRTSIMDNETTGSSKARHFWLIGRVAADTLLSTPAAPLPRNRCIVRKEAATHQVSKNHPW